MAESTLHFETEKNEFEKSERLDVFFFIPKHIDAEKKLLNSKYPLVKFKDLIDFMTDGKHGGWSFVEKGILFLRNTNVKENYLDLIDVKYISKEDNELLPRAHLKEGDLLFTTIGTIGVSAIVSKNCEGANINQNLVRIVLKKGIIEPMFASLFLNTDMGRAQSERYATGNIQKLINYPTIKNFLIPLPPKNVQKEIINLYNESNKKISFNLSRITKLKEGLYDFFCNISNLKESTKREKNIYVSQIGDRFDPYFYNPVFTNNLNSIKDSNKEIKTLGDCSIFSEEGLSFKNGVFKYIQIQDIDAETHRIVSHTLTDLQNAPGRARMMIEKDDILIPTLGGSLNSMAIVSKEYDGQIATNGFSVIKIKNSFLRKYIFYFLTTKFAESQIKQKLTGTIMSSISKNDLSSIIIPIPTKQDIETFSLKFDEVITSIYNLLNDNKKIKSEFKIKIEESLIK